jgi:hypothetical protein
MAGLLRMVVKRNRGIDDKEPLVFDAVRLIIYL